MIFQKWSTFTRPGITPAMVGVNTPLVPSNTRRKTSFQMDWTEFQNYFEKNIFFRKLRFLKKGCWPFLRSNHQIQAWKHESITLICTFLETAAFQLSLKLLNIAIGYHKLGLVSMTKISLKNPSDFSKMAVLTRLWLLDLDNLHSESLWIQSYAMILSSEEKSVKKISQKKILKKYAFAEKFWTKN